MVVCGRCGTVDNEDAVKCTECGDYLHQYRRRLDQPHRIAALIGLIFAAIIVAGAFLPWVHVLDLFQLRFADAPDGLIILGAALAMLTASILTFARSDASMLRVVARVCGACVLAVLAADLLYLHDRTAHALGALNDAVRATLPDLGDVSIFNLLGSGIYVMALGALGTMLLGIFAPAPARSALITDLPMQPAGARGPGTVRADVPEPVARPTAASVRGSSTTSYDELYGVLSSRSPRRYDGAVLAVIALIVCVGVGWGASSYFAPSLPKMPAGRIVENRAAHLTGAWIPERLVVSSTGAQNFGTASRDTVSIYQWHPFSWHLIYRTAGTRYLEPSAASAPTLYPEAFEGGGGIVSRYIGAFPLLPGHREVVAFGTASCGASCTSETLRLSAWKHGALRTIFTIGGPQEFSKVRMTDRGLRIVGDAYGPEDPHCCPSRKNASSTIALTDDGQLAVLDGGDFMQAQDDVSDHI